MQGKGLAIAKEMAVRHGASIVLEFSEALGGPPRPSVISHCQGRLIKPVPKVLQLTHLCATILKDFATTGISI